MSGRKPVGITLPGRDDDFRVPTSTLALPRPSCLGLVWHGDGNARHKHPRPVQPVDADSVWLWRGKRAEGRTSASRQPPPAGLFEVVLCITFPSGLFEGLHDLVTWSPVLPFCPRASTQSAVLHLITLCRPVLLFDKLFFRPVWNDRSISFSSKI